MKITYDPAKREATLKERGLDFAGAAAVFAGPTYSAEDKRRAYGETRVITVGLLDGRMVVVGWTPRDGDRHVFSMRKANDREQAKYFDRLVQADAYENTPADYEELPELDDTFFARAERIQTMGHRSVPHMTYPDEAARIARLRDAIIEIWGRSAYDVKEVRRGPDGGLLLSFEPVGVEDKRTDVDND